MAQTAPPAPSAAMDPAASARRIEDRLHELQSAQRTTRWILLAFSLFMLAALLIFAWSLYSTLRESLNEDDLRVAAMERVEYHGPRLQQRLTEAATLAYPTYREEAMQRLQKITPMLQEQAQAELEAMPDKIRESLEGRVESLLEEIEEEATARMKKDFAFLNDEEKVERLTNHLVEELHTASEGIEKKLTKVHDEESQRLAQTLERFDIPSNEGVSQDELERRLVENVLLLAVHFVQNPDAAQGGLLDKIKPEDAAGTDSKPSASTAN